MSSDILSGLSSSDQAFRLEILAFLKRNLTPSMREAGRNTIWAISDFEQGRQWQKVLHREGFGAVHWPVEYGGKDWTRSQKMIWDIETLRADAPRVMNMGRDLCAPCIMEFGTDAQKAQFLPPILSGDDWWAQGFSEPGAGSDLASLQLAGVQEGDEFVLNGSKIWTTFAQHANRIFCLVRTGPSPKKQMGISFLLIDLDSPGIEIRPIYTIAGEHEFNQVFFTDVRVPMDRLLGKQDDGWAVVRYLLMHEHGGVNSASAMLGQRISWVREIMSQEQDGEGRRLIENPEYARRFAELLIEVQAVHFAERESLAASNASGAPSRLGELLSIRSREVGKKLNELAMRSVGVYAAPFQRDARMVGAGVAPIGPDHAVIAMPFFLGQQAATIAGGTPEIHRNNIAKRLLEL